MTESHGYRNRPCQQLTSSWGQTSTLIIWRFHVECTSDVRNQPSLQFHSFQLHWINDSKTTGFPGDIVVKNLPASVGDEGLTSAWGGAPEKEMATRSSILAWTIPWMRSLSCWGPRGQEESDTAQQLNTNRHTCREMQRLTLCTGDKPLYWAWGPGHGRECGRILALSAFYI